MTLLCQVVGFGPAALGLPVAADRLGLLDCFLERGVCFLDRSRDREEMRETRFPYVVVANSTGQDFYEAISTTGQLRAALVGPAARSLRQRAADQIPLSLVGAFMNELTDVVLAAVDGSPSRLVHGVDIRSIVRNADSTFTSYTAEGSQVSTSQSVVLATGARQDTSLSISQPDGLSVSSAAVLGGELDEIALALAAGQPVTILGGSHSGFAVASLILERFGDRVRSGQLTILHRDVVLFFDDLTAAQDWVNFAGDLSKRPLRRCADTGLVNRFRGLRGPSKQLCRAVVTGTESRVRLVHADDPQADRVIRDAGLVVNAYGYRTAHVDLLDDRSRPIDVSWNGGLVAVDEHCRVLDGHGSPIEGVYGLGLGYARVDAGGEGRAAINVFHGTDAEAIVQSLLRVLTTSTGPAPMIASSPMRGGSHGQSVR